MKENTEKKENLPQKRAIKAHENPQEPQQAPPPAVATAETPHSTPESKPAAPEPDSAQGQYRGGCRRSRATRLPARAQRAHRAADATSGHDGTPRHHRTAPGFDPERPRLSEQAESVDMGQVNATPTETHLTYQPF